MKLSEAPLGLRVAMVESMDDERSNEVRYTFWERTEGVARFNSNPNKPTAFVTAVRVRMTQGEPGEKPRYDTGEIRIETEVDGRINVVDAATLPIGALKREVANTDVPTVRQQADLVYLAAALRSDNPELVQAINAAILMAKLAGIVVPHRIGIGDRFAFGDGTWLCTDVGYRTITAIRTTNIRDRSWYIGPPYAVAEITFDEDEIIACEIIECEI